MEDGEQPLDPLAAPDTGFDVALDFDLDGAASASAAGGGPSRPSRFRPKLKGKVKAEPSADQGPIRPLPPPLAPIKKLEEKDEQVEVGVVVAKAEEPADGPSSALAAAADGMGAATSCSGPMDEEEEEDYVIREIDVFFTFPPVDKDTFLYVMQYPLRPSWRPYELNDRCEEVRVKPKQSKIEVDLSIDVDSENYDDQEVAAPLRLEKQTLSSSKAPFVTSYAIGILRGNQLHLNPVHAVVQLRPSMAHVNAGSQKRKQNARGVEVSVKPTDDSLEESLKTSSRKGKQAVEEPKENIDEVEPWISLEYHPMDSDLTKMYHQKMMAKGNTDIRFAMNSFDYINSLCPGTSTDNKRARGPPRRVLLSMSLEERLKKWFSEGSQVNHFDALMHFAPDESAEDVLEVLPLHADLVQGLWVSKSSLLHEGLDASYRDYILFLFSRKLIIRIDELATLGLRADAQKRILSPLAAQRPTFKDWKFKEGPDFSFIKRYPDIVKQQEFAWTSRLKDVIESLRKSGKNIPMMTKNMLNANVAKRSAAVGMVSSTPTTMSNETRENLPRALEKIFQTRRVCSLNSIIHGLRDFAISNSSRPRDDPRVRALINAAREGASAPPTELQVIVGQVAVNIHDVYVLKSLGNQALDPLRNVVIELCRGMERSAKLTRQLVRQAAQLRLNRDISNAEYHQVVSELCNSTRGGWVLKSGD